MNIDTDMQWAFWKGVHTYYNANQDRLQHQIGTSTDPDAPNKKFYDPRVWLREAEKSMIERLKVAFKDLNCMNRIA
jgi:fructose-bisphosphate aldolase class II